MSFPVISVFSIFYHKIQTIKTLWGKSEIIFTQIALYWKFSAWLKKGETLYKKYRYGLVLAKSNRKNSIP